jgi:hypothetical protein
MCIESILTDDFTRTVAEAGRRARQAALAAGHPVVFRDNAGRYVEEHPDGRRFEVAFDPTKPRESHRVILRELPSARETTLTSDRASLT